MVERQPIDDPKKHVRRQFERCQADADVENVRMNSFLIEFGNTVSVDSSPQKLSNEPSYLKPRDVEFAATLPLEFVRVRESAG